GTIAIANAKMAYLLYEEIYQSDLAKTLMRQDATSQRLLWASTSTKNKRYSDVLYVESLIAKNTVNTLPPATLEAFRDHGRVSNSIKDDIFKAAQKMSALSSLGIDFKACCEELLIDGLKLFSNDFDQLLHVVEEKLTKLREKP
ncbi:MAG TPA: transaldolase family protein, partial [Myxococcota bacterium]|nr:transaldolase family protein [Myxococcota bacterium]